MSSAPVRLSRRIAEESPPCGVYGFLDEKRPDGTPYFQVAFADLPISKPTLTGLGAAKYVTMTQVQRGAIPHALYGRDILATAVTGSGKTLAFLVPALEKLYRESWSTVDGLGVLIIEPARELAIQVFETLRLIGRKLPFSAGLVIGGKDVAQEKKKIASMNILVATPGRLLQHFLETPHFSADNLQVLIIDEADRVLDMGFQESINAILEYLPQKRQTLLFSATLSKSIQSLAKLSLKSPEYINFLSKTDADDDEALATPKKLNQHYTIVPLDHKLDLIYSFLRSHLKQKIILFLSSCKQVRFAFEAMKRLHPGIPLMEIHGKQKQSKRSAVFFSFLEKTEAALFATDVAARGLDFPAVDWVVQVDCPEDVSSYIHRVGRTARYKSTGNSLLFLLPSEALFLDFLSAKSIPIKQVNVKAKKTVTIKPALHSFVAADPELKHLAEKSLISYVRSVFLMPNKEIFDVKKLPLAEYADSIGLASSPSLTFKSTEVEAETPQKKSKLAKLKEKIKAKKAASDEIIRMKRTNLALEDVGLEEEVPPTKVRKTASAPLGRVVNDTEELEDLRAALISKVEASRDDDKEAEKQRKKDKRLRKKIKEKERSLDDS